METTTGPFESDGNHDSHLLIILEIIRSVSFLFVFLVHIFRDDHSRPSNTSVLFLLSYRTQMELTSSVLVIPEVGNLILFLFECSSRRWACFDSVIFSLSPHVKIWM